MTDVEDDFDDSWIDVDDVFPDLGKRPFFIPGDRYGKLLDRLQQTPFEVMEIDLSDLRSDEEFVAEFGEKIGASLHFDGNWVSLSEILKDRAREGDWKIALIILGGRDFAARNLHSYSRLVSLLPIIGGRLSHSCIGQLETFYIED